MEELAGVVNMYPWYGGARKELCRRMSRSGGESWGTAQYADEALHIADRRMVADLLRRSRDEDWSDRDVERILKSYIARGSYPSQEPVVRERRVSRGPVPGDYFSTEEYDEVRREDDNFLSRRAPAEPVEPEEARPRIRLTEDIFCTETLAEVYVEQGYFEEAKRIYSKLLLAYPEKSVYFASLIEKMDLLLNN